MTEPMTEPRQATDEGLVRGIGTWALGANVVNMIIGAGIFVLPGVVAASLGATAVLAYLACAVVVALVFLSFAEVGSRITRSGGSYAYIEDAFGPFAGFIASILFWFGWSVLSDAAIAVAMTDAIGTGFPLLQETLPRDIFLIALFGFLAVINIMGLKAGVRLFVVNTIAKLVPLLVLAGAGLLAIDFDKLTITSWPTAAAFGSTTLVLFFAFAGAESALNASGEIERPASTVPRGLLLGISAVLLLYLSLQTVAQGTLGPALADNTEAPLAATATVVLGGWGTQLLMAGLVISIFGTLSGDVLVTPRVLFAAARDGLLPKPLARVHPRHHTPHVAIVFYTLLGCGFALSGTFRYLAVLASGSILLIYLGVSLAVLRLRRIRGMPGPGEFRIPGGPAVPVLSAAVVILLLSQMAKSEAIGLAALVAVAVVLYLGRAVWQRSSAG